MTRMKLWLGVGAFVFVQNGLSITSSSLELSPGGTPALAGERGEGHERGERGEGEEGNERGERGEGEEGEGEEGERGRRRR